VLRIALDTSDKGRLDPHVGVSANERAVISYMFSALVRYKPGDMTVFEPDLAESVPEPELRDGRQVWVFQLRQGVRTHPFPGYPDGYELTAEDVVYSFKRVADAKRSSFAGSYKGMNVDASGEYTVVFTLEEALSPSLFLPLVVNFGGGFVVPRKAVEALGDEGFGAHPVGTGPFIYADYVPLTRVVLSGFSAYFRGKPVLDRVEVYYIPDVSARELALLSGAVHAIAGVREEVWVESMEAKPGIKAVAFGPGSICPLYINRTVPPLDSLGVRRAIFYALDRDDIVGIFGEGVAEPTYSILPTGYMPGALTLQDLEEAGYTWQYQQDLQEARRLLVAAGYPSGFTLRVFASERADYQLLYQWVERALAPIGVKLDITLVDHTTFHAKYRANENPFVFLVTARANSDIYLTTHFHSASRVVVGASPNLNFTQYTSVDAYIEQARIETDPVSQAEFWKLACLQIAEDAVAYPTFVLKPTYAYWEYLDWGYEVRSFMNTAMDITEQTRLMDH
jgi:peptide/nickel transport system substrate-binding protein